VVELRSLKPDEDGPSGDAWVLIEKHDGVYSITARQNGASVDASVAPPAFDTPEAAMHAATTWADLLSVPVIYVRGER
jgi:hypothetical protein